MLPTVLQAFYHRFIDICEQFTAKNNWMLRLALVLPFTVLLFAFPSYERLATEFAESWRAVLAQAAHPFTPGRHEPTSHQAKMAFRLTVPLVARMLHLGVVGILLLQAVAGAVLFYLSAKLFLRLTGDKTAALLLTLSLSFIYAGRVSFTEIRGIFDGVAMLFLVVSMSFSNPLLVFTGVFLAAWTDERGLIATSLVMLFWVHSAQSALRKAVNPTTVAVFLAWAAYFVTRYLVARTFGLSTPTQGVGIRLLIDQTNNLPVGVWSALEGCWLLVLSSLLVLWRHKQLVFSAAYVGSISLLLLVAMSVVDITRSMAYLLPTFFLATMIVAKSETQNTFRKVVFVAMLLSFAYPAYYTGGDYYINWTYPLPLQLFRYAFGSGT